MQQSNMPMSSNAVLHQENWREYNYKIPAVSSQSKIISSSSGGVTGGVYRGGNPKKFIINGGQNQINMMGDNQGRSGFHQGGSNSINGVTRQQRAATQGGHIFGG
mmetsp:Transcript_15574/g.26303  ORF Transcript_15574/g.26303 Transcript_15574/m.26303 type:complete len:105 (+) Transcript_15574:410-724(+)